MKNNVKAHIPYKQTGYFSKLIVDYLKKEEKTLPFYNNYPDKKGFEKQIEQKQSFDTNKRKILVTELHKQYQNSEPSEKVTQHIQALHKKNTFTVTTGHQLNIFTGPLYVLYKIVTTINLAKQLTKLFPQYTFVPVYWMATEDHDFAEINHFYYQNNRITWNKKAGGAVGELTTKGLEKVFEEFLIKIDSNSYNAQQLSKWFESAYLKHQNLAEATRFLVHQLFKEEGLVIVDANTKSFKTLFKNFIKDELIHQISYKNIRQTSVKLEKEYNAQVNPRKINLFYIKEKLRERLIFENGKYKVNRTSITFTKEELLVEIEKYPERFSPNVVMRPLYQETILPNLCYIGGGGELAYWFQLKSYFEQSKVPFPILLLRNSVLLVTKAQLQKAEKLHVSVEDFFLKQKELEEKKVRELSTIIIDFTKQKTHLKQQFVELKEIARQTDKSFIGAVNAQEKKQLNGLDKLEKRLLIAQKRRFKDELERIKKLQNQLFPKQSLQERHTNFSEFYKELGEAFIPLLLKHLQPLKHQFLILKIP